MSRSTADWQALLDVATPGPWWDGYMNYLLCDQGALSGPFARTEDVTLAASAPEAVAEVIRLREELEGLQKHMRYQPNNILADEVASAIRIILEGDKS